MDGTVARITKRQSDYGGYVDILADFIIYSLVPIAMAYSQTSFQLYFIVCLLEATYFVNAASLFFLAGILEKRVAGAKEKKELTTLTMPTGLVEGFETCIFYGLFMNVPFDYLPHLFIIFGIGVFLTIMQRWYWASVYL